MGRKKAKAKGLPKTMPRHTQFEPRQLSSLAVSAVAQQFSLRDEARYMSSHRSSAFDSSKKLRHLPVTFVSAGCLQGTVKEKPPQAEPAEPVAPAPPSPSPSPPNPGATEALAQMTIRSASASSSASGEDLVVFRGRGGRTAAMDHYMQNVDTPLTLPMHPAPSAPSVAPPVMDLKTESQPGAVAEQAASVTNTPHLTVGSSDEHVSIVTQVTTSHEVHDASDVDSDTNSVVDALFEKRRGGRPKWDGHVTPWVSRSKPGIGWLPVNNRPNMDSFVKGQADPRQAAMDDYMQNIDISDLTDNVGASAAFARREMDLDTGTHNDWSEGEPEIPPETEQDHGWTSDQLHDLDGMSTSTDVEGTVVRITGRRTRRTGVLQYQVVYEGYTEDDYHWFPVTHLTTPSDKVLIEKYEAVRLAREQQVPSSSESDSEFDLDGESSEEIDELDDEQIARAWQKQEDIGIDSNELVLHAADAYFGGPVNAGSVTSRTTFDRPNKRRQQRVGGGRRTEPSYPSASAMAEALDMDPYGAFDIMDTERPSLRPKKKGRRGQMPPELDDSDLNEQMKATWEADRTKKRLKKAEREELRKQGLLGRKGKGPDLSVKYKEGIIMPEIIEEIRTFMASDMQTLSLPAMEAHRRAGIHQFVSEFGISSKSHGDGANRHTIVSKTKRTVVFDDDLFDEILGRKKYNRRLLAQDYTNRPKKDKSLKTRPVVSYKDGEVVGAKASELGPENKGRAMLEKMGWSKGMALGALNNKGILQPIAHTVKITKAGLR